MGTYTNTYFDSDVIFPKIQEGELLFYLLKINSGLPLGCTIGVKFDADVYEKSCINPTFDIQNDFTVNLSEISTAEMSNDIELDFSINITSKEHIEPESIIGQVDFKVHNIVLVTPRKFYELEDLTMGDLETMTLENLYFKEVDN